MKAVVVDASIAAKWFLPEPYAPQAFRLLDGHHRLLAPDLIWPELANILWKNHRRGLITADEAAELLGQFLALPVETTESSALVPAALELAMRTARTVYDCLYLALAAHANCPMITADERLVNALSSGRLAAHVR